MKLSIKWRERIGTILTIPWFVIVFMFIIAPVFIEELRDTPSSVYIFIVSITLMFTLGVVLLVDAKYGGKK